MASDIDVPTPPDVTNRGTPAQFADETAPRRELDLRRADIEAILEEGAWRDGFDEWAQYTDLEKADVAQAEELGLFRAVDFYWDFEAGRLRYVVPAVPAEWDERAGDDRTSASALQGDLDDLARTVAETIASDYVDWGEAGPSDLVSSADGYGQVPDEADE